MRRLRQFKRWSLIPVLVWIAAQLAMTGAVAVEPAYGDSRAAGPYGTIPIVICTPTGVIEMDAEALGLPEATSNPEPQSQIDRGECKWCKAFSLVDLPGRTAASSRNPYASEQRPIQIAETRPASLHCAADGFRSRAPPMVDC